MSNLGTFLQTLLESLFSLFDKKEIVKLVEKPIIKPEPKIEEPKPEKPIDKLIEELKEKIKEREEPKEPEEPKEIEVTFEDALKFVLKWEGFISNDPADPGGLTIWGISYRSYPKEVLEMERLINEVKKDEAFAIAKKIYYENFWLKADCDKLPSPFNLIVFDTAINCGKSRAKEFYDASTDWQDYLFKRIDYYTKCEKFNIFGRGWLNRVVDLYKEVK